MSEDYAREKAYATVLILVTGSGDVKDRLEDAVLSQFHRIDARRDLPGRLQPEYDAIMRDVCTIEPEGDEGRIAATIRKMSDEDASKIAERVFSLYMALLGTEPL